MRSAEEDNRLRRYMPSFTCLEEKVTEYHFVFHILLQWSIIFPRDIIFEIGKHYYNLWSPMGDAYSIFPTMMPHYSGSSINEQDHITVQFSYDDSAMILRVMHLSFDFCGRYSIGAIKVVRYDLPTDENPAVKTQMKIITYLFNNLYTPDIQRTEIHLFCDERLKDAIRNSDITYRYHLYDNDADWLKHNSMDLLFQYDKPVRSRAHDDYELAHLVTYIIADLTCYIALGPCRFCYESDDISTIENYIYPLIKCMEKYQQKQIKILQDAKRI